MHVSTISRRVSSILLIDLTFGFSFLLRLAHTRFFSSGSRSYVFVCLCLYSVNSSKWRNRATKARIEKTPYTFYWLKFHSQFGEGMRLYFWPLDKRDREDILDFSKATHADALCALEYPKEWKETNFILPSGVHRLIYGFNWKSEAAWTSPAQVAGEKRLRD